MSEPDNLFSFLALPMSPGADGVGRWGEPGLVHCKSPEGAYLGEREGIFYGNSLY